jgi:DNA repair protein RadC
MEMNLTDIGKNTIVNNSASIGIMMQKFLMQQNEVMRGQEHFWVVGLEEDNTISFIELVALGKSNLVIIDPVQIFRLGMSKNVYRAIVVHNHPTGILVASPEDIATTQRLIAAGAFVGIKIIDHLIVCETDYISLRDEGLFDELENNKQWPILSKEEAQQQRLELQKQEQKNGKLKVAKNLKEIGMDEDQIIQLTGLDANDIQTI